MDKDKDKKKQILKKEEIDEERVKEVRKSPWPMKKSDKEYFGKK